MCVHVCAASSTSTVSARPCGGGVVQLRLARAIPRSGGKEAAAASSCNRPGPSFEDLPPPTALHDKVWAPARTSRLRDATSLTRFHQISLQSKWHYTTLHTHTLDNHKGRQGSRMPTPLCRASGTRRPATDDGLAEGNDEVGEGVTMVVIRLVCVCVYVCVRAYVCVHPNPSKPHPWLSHTCARTHTRAHAHTIHAHEHTHTAGTLRSRELQTVEAVRASLREREEAEGEGEGQRSSVRAHGEERRSSSTNAEEARRIFRAAAPSKHAREKRPPPFAIQRQSGARAPRSRAFPFTSAHT